ncbi:MAG: hypothetical protein GX980_03545 [Firmicutes bacterium]|nr:hypothetical protein [Bacillota bacterium]
MLFMVGLELLSPEEKIALLSQLNAVTSLNVFNQGLQKGFKTLGDGVASITTWLVGRASPRTGELMRQTKDALSRDVDVINRAVDNEAMRLSRLHPRTVSRQLYRKVRALAQVDASATRDQIAAALINRAAVNLGMDVHLYPDAISLENAVFEAIIKEQMEALKARLAGASAKEIADLEEILGQELAKLSEADRKAIREVIGVDEISARTFINFLHSTSALIAAQTLIGGFGFGSFLFLTTAIKAFSLLIGVTFPFSVYMAATSTLAFLLSAPFLAISATFLGGYVLRKTSTRLDDELAKMIIQVGRVKLLANKTEAEQKGGPQPGRLSS